MYLHLGQNTLVRTETIIGIFDIENTSVSPFTRRYLAQAQKTGRVVNVSPELPKSFIVCEENKEVTVYIAQIAPSTLKKRSGFIAGL